MCLFQDSDVIWYTFKAVIFCAAVVNKKEKLCLSIHDPFLVVAELDGNEFSEGAGDFFVFAAIAGKNVEIVSGDTDARCKILFGNILFSNDLIQPVRKRHRRSLLDFVGSSTQHSEAFAFWTIRRACPECCGYGI